MRSLLSKKQAHEAIGAFFRRSSWSPEELKKLKRRAMKYRIRLGAYRKSFCKTCLLPLKGSIRVTKTHKTVVCKTCGVCNRHAIKRIPNLVHSTVRFALSAASCGVLHSVQDGIL